MQQLNFNTLDRLVASDQWQALAGQARESIHQMQTAVPQFGIQPHVVLPIFKKTEDEAMSKSIYITAQILEKEGL